MKRKHEMGAWLKVGALLMWVAGCTEPPAAPVVEPPTMGTEALPKERGELDVVARLDLAPGNITVDRSGPIVSLHQFFDPPYPVARVTPAGELVPFAREAELDSVLGLQVDGQGIVWLLDNALRSSGEPQLVAWDPGSDREVRSIPLGGAAVPGSFMNDLAIDGSGFIYIADPANGPDAALVVVDLSDGTVRRVLEGHESVVPEPVDLVIDGKPITVRTPSGEIVRPRIGVNPIALDHRGEWLYFGPMHGTSMYRLRAEHLRHGLLGGEALAEQVERFADKPICDGIAMDGEDNIYLGDLANDAVGVIDAKGTYRVLVQDPRLSWPDAFALGSDGSLYTVPNQLHRAPPLNGGVNGAEPPFLVVRIGL